MLKRDNRKSRRVAVVAAVGVAVGLAVATTPNAARGDPEL